MKMYQQGSYYADIKARGEAPMFWFSLVCMLGPFAAIPLVHWLFA